jgi:hypothetical protein
MALEPPESDPNPNRPSQMWKKIEQQGDHITVRTQAINKAGVEAQVFVFVVGTRDNANHMHGAPMTSSVEWKGDALPVDSVARYGDGDLRMNDTYVLSANEKELTFQERHQFGNEQEGVDEEVFLHQADSAWPGNGPAKSAEELYKNIQVLKGTPGLQLQTTMALFAQSLGVSCAYCHVPDEFDRDDRPAKLTARKMIRMLHAVNDNFNGTQPVSCWTCHRGKTKPESVPQ